MKVVAIIQARMGSTRLPGKMLMEIGGKPVIELVYDRVLSAKRINQVWLATTSNAEDDVLASWALSHQLATFRGSSDDVLDRYYQAALTAKADIIVRITGDCPLHDSQIIDTVVGEHVRSKNDYTSNVHPATYPDGLDVEVVSFPALKKAWQEAQLASEREHVTPYIWKHPELFKLGNVVSAVDQSRYRLTLDTPEDLEVISHIAREIESSGQHYTLHNVLKIAASHPEWMAKNAAHQRNEGFIQSVHNDKKSVNNKVSFYKKIRHTGAPLYRLYRTAMRRLRQAIWSLRSSIIWLIYSKCTTRIVDLGSFKGPLNKEQLTMYLTPNWYHNFSILGIVTPQDPTDKSAEAHQTIKQEILFPFIDEAIALSKKNSNEPMTGIELFCADGFFSNYAISKGADKMLGIDIEEDSGEGKKRQSVLAQARLATTLLGNGTQATFQHQNVFDLNTDFTFCICAGGLYHIADPKRLLQILSKHVKQYLVIQTVVSLENEDPNYFEQPAPGWKWGCRFSHEKLLSMIEESGWIVVKEARNELICNNLLSDRGSSYVLCKNKNAQ